VLALEPCGPPDTDILNVSLESLRLAGINIDYQPYDRNAGERLGERGIAARLSQLKAGLTGVNYDYLLCVRGGYGASDLLALIDWPALAEMNPRPLIGFSDVSALQSAFYARLGWPGLHAPMPGSPLWKNGPDVDQLTSYLQKGRPWRGRISVVPVKSKAQEPCRGLLFGGCLSVLTNLIGTAYLPSSFAGHILFFEDTGESSSRVLRCWRQWLDCGLLEGVHAVVLARFLKTGSKGSEDWLRGEIAQRSPCPVFASEDFGHVSPNMPLCMGAKAEISGDSLQWTLGS
jgi:muramoyltetrapeptide carboxypeptidase